MSDAAHRFAGLTTAAATRLPFGLSHVVAPTLLGFCLINGCTFLVDLACLWVARSALGWPVAVAVSLGYATAFTLSYLLNRVLNFRSHGPVGGQLVRYVPVVVANYVVLVLGLVEFLHRLGMGVLPARVLSACCEAVFMYLAMRLLVFRTRPSTPPADVADIERAR